MEEIIKDYLENEIKKDPALAEKYEPGKIKSCIAYITEQARNFLGNTNGGVPDTVVYKWARDFYIEGESQNAEMDKDSGSEGVKEACSENTEKPKQKVTKAKTKEKVEHVYTQMEMF